MVDLRGRPLPNIPYATNMQLLSLYVMLAHMSVSERQSECESTIACFLVSREWRVNKAYGLAGTKII